MGGSSKKGGGQIEVNDYLMSLHLGVCAEADAFTSIIAGEKVAWTGRQSSVSQVIINKPDLFGGSKKEGGMVGLATFLPGSPDQLLPDYLATRLGRESGADCPGFRGLASVFLTGYNAFPNTFNERWSDFQDWVSSPEQPSTSGGFKLVSNNPYMKDIWVGVKRAPKGLNPSLAYIPRSSPDSVETFEAGAPVKLTWWQRTFNQITNDQGRMGIAFVNSSGNLIEDQVQVIATTLDGSAVSNSTVNVTDTTAWTPSLTTSYDRWTERSLTVQMPQDAQAIRLYLEMTRITGGNNDGYIDDISLAIADQPVTVPYGNAETNSDFGWTVERGELATRSTNPAPHGGSYYFCGGTAAITTAYTNVTPEATADDANPAHMIYECLTNVDWGMGAPSTIIDVVSFEQAGQALYDEGLGLSMIWTRQSTIESFVSEIIDHIQATVFVNPRTGLLTLKLLRADYDEDELRVVDADNAILKSYQRKVWGEVVNEIVVTWTNPESEADETVSLHDLGSIVSQGGIVSDSRNYYGVRKVSLAMQLAARDLRSSSSPFAICEVELNRSAWNLLPGEVVKFNWPEYGVTNMVMRVGAIDYGKPGEPNIKATLTEDIFGLDSAEYTDPPSTAWEDQDRAPEPLVHYKILTVPAYMVQNYGQLLTNYSYPEVVAAIFGTGEDVVSFDVYGPMIQPDGTTANKVLTTNTALGYGVLRDALPIGASSTGVGFQARVGTVRPDTNVFVFIGGDDTGDADMEVALITGSDDTGYTLARGVLDTIPRNWPDATPVWFMNLSSSITDMKVRSDGETLEVKLLTRTFKGVLRPSETAWVSGTLTGRPHFPLRPANVKVNSVGFATEVDCRGLTTIPVSWSNRNRTMENSQIVRWDEATVTPEDGQTTTVTVMSSDRTVLATYSDLTGTSHSVPASDFGSNQRGIISVSSSRDGLDSLQAYELAVRIADTNVSVTLPTITVSAPTATA
jgi:Putative phage tail protein